MLTAPRTARPLRHRAPRRSGGLPIHVLVVDDHPTVRQGVGRLIAEQPDMATIAEASRADAAAGELARWADIAVIDYHLGARDGLWLTRQIRERPGAPRVLIYSAFADHRLTVAAIVAGADAVLPKVALEAELCATIRMLARGRQQFPAVPAPLVTALRARLAPDDRPIYDALMHSRGRGDLAQALGVAPAELEYRRAAMLRALAPRNERAGSYGPLDYARPRRARS